MALRNSSVNVVPSSRWYCVHIKTPHSFALSCYCAVAHTLLMIWKYRLVILKKAVMTMSWSPEIKRISLSFSRIEEGLAIIVAYSFWYCLHGNACFFWGGGCKARWRNVAYLIRKFLRMVKLYPLNVV